MNREFVPLTAAGLIEALGRIPADTVITWTEDDHDWDTWHEIGISGVSEDGGLGHGGIVASGFLSDFNEDEDESDEADDE